MTRVHVEGEGTAPARTGARNETDHKRQDDDHLDETATASLEVPAADDSAWLTFGFVLSRCLD